MELQECLYLNAKDDIYYGYSKEFFINDNMERYPEATKEECIKAWEKAFNYMCKM